MIISHRHKFIFIKTRKTAGTSIEITLSRYCGKEDIITPISLEDEKIRRNLGISPQNYDLDGRKYYNHMPAKEIMATVDQKTWNTYYKFCLDRNPWDKVISLYYYVNRNKSKVSFDNFLNSGGYQLGYNFPLYTIDEKTIVDYLGKYENMKSDITDICNQINVPFDGWFPHAKGEFRKEKGRYRDFYNSSQRKMIENYFKKEIELLQYKF